MTFVDPTRGHTEWYRRGHNEHDWKSCDGQKPSEGSNPSHSAKTPNAIAFGVFFFLFHDTFEVPGSSNNFFVAAAFLVAPQSGF